MIDSQLPTAVEAEAHVIGAILKEPKCMYVVTDYIQLPQEFYDPRHRTIYSYCWGAWSMGNECDVITIADLLQKHGKLEDCGGRTYLMELCENAIVSGSVKSHARMVNQAYNKRELLGVCKSVITNINGKMDYDELVGKIQEVSFSLTPSGGHRTRPIDKIVQEAYESLVALNEGVSRADVTTGFVDLDRLVELIPGRLIVLAGRPSMGKSALAGNIAEHVGIVQRKQVEFFTIEMSDTEVASRMLLGRSDLPLQTLRERKATVGDLTRLGGAAKEISSSLIQIHDVAGMSVARFRNACREGKLKRNCSLVIVDYLQLMRPDRPTDSDTHNVSEVSKSVKEVSKEINVPIIAVAQLSRALEYRTNKEPNLADLRSSGQIEQDAHIVGFVHRPWYYFTEEEKAKRENEDKKNEGVVIVQKNRDGALGRANLHWTAELARFNNLARDVA